jgi:hypothetical protein
LVEAAEVVRDLLRAEDDVVGDLGRAVEDACEAADHRPREAPPDQMGHASVTITLNLYGHLYPR